MSDLSLQLEDGIAAFQPGDTLRGEAAWSVPDSDEPIEVRLVWYTQGKGTRDVGVAAVQPLGSTATGRAKFQFTLPNGPYSFSGKLISLIWAAELVAGNHSTRTEIVVAPGGSEVILTGEGGDDARA